MKNVLHGGENQWGFLQWQVGQTAWGNSAAVTQHLIFNHIVFVMFCAETAMFLSVPPVIQSHRQNVSDNRWTSAT